ncbi:hypothetical protein DH26_gp043 [Chloriridovirus anopheles1]|uniref:TFIIS-type domain-containing protein n=1 Tax=Chloriridovirus anopheles1 TaxID=1465751 RepID=W8QMZ0_9VIRU|nr:hypothetical protein DH26_gp043 [Anopheles minimus iridovirus]AHL67538.1 hypothetical protein AMIV_043 [Anopheles minimus iridovirus]
MSDREELCDILGRYFSKSKNIQYVLNKTSGPDQHKKIYELMCMLHQTKDLSRVLPHLKTNQLIWKKEVFEEEIAKEEEENNFMVSPYEISEGVLECRKCGCKQIFSFSKQTRSADEPTTVFALCSKCGHKWCEGS